MSQTPALQYVRHGQTPFFRLPLAAFEKGGAAAYRETDAVVLGAPFDGGTSYQPGARFAPYHVRRVSALIGSYHPTHRIDVFERLSVVDGGNAIAPPFDDAAVRELVRSEIDNVLEAGAVPFLVGGDHSVVLPALRAIHAHYGAVAVVHVDAHFDTSGPEIWGAEHHHGTPLRHALDEGLIETGQLYQLGLRATWNDHDDPRRLLRREAPAGHLSGDEEVARSG